MIKFDEKLIRGCSFSTRELLGWAMRNPEVRKRIWFTLGALIIVRAVFFVPLPGLDVSVLKVFFEKLSRTGVNGWDLLLGFSRNFNELTVFGLSIGPFISACLLIQLGSILVPQLRHWSFGGEEGRRKIQRYSYLLATAIAIMQSLFISLRLENSSNFEGLQIVSSPGWLFRILVIASMTAGTLLLLAAAQLINRYGFGNGVAVIVLSSVAMDFALAVRRMIILQAGDPLNFVRPLLGLTVAVALFYVTYRIASHSWKVPIGYGEQGPSVLVPLRMTSVGTQPIHWGMSLIWYGVGRIPSALTRGVSSLALASVIILLATYAYGAIVFNPRYVCGLAERYGYSVSAELLKRQLGKLLLMTGLFLAAVAQLPMLLGQFFAFPYLISFALGGTGVIVTAGVFCDFLAQIEFFRKRKQSGIKDWSIGHTVSGEFEATIKSSYLSSKKIPALVEPLRFTWGIPIGTAVDQYRIYVPSEKAEQARELVKP